MNISSLARQLKATTPELLERLPDLGFDIGAKAIKVDDSLVPKIISAWKKDLKKTRLKEELSKVKEVSDQKEEAGKEEKLEINIGETIIVKDMAELMKLPVAKLMGELMKNGIMVSLNEKIDFDTASIIAEDLGFQVIKNKEEEEEDKSNREKLGELLAKRKGKNEKPPVVVVMGHVDHGKTKLLDAIRNTNIIDQEAGNITQHIGAYQAEDKGRLITFLDTPGHEAFKAMRSRGGQIADVAILVVAADDGLQPQTLESIAVIQKEKLPFIIALNKIDKDNADIEKVKQQLSEINLIPEDWGGDIICHPISAKFNKGIKELLDLVLLIADMKELKADYQGPALGTIIESHIDKSEGPVATILVQAGTLRIGDMFLVGAVPGKIKILRDWKGYNVKESTPGTPVKILGLKQLPKVGEILEVIIDKKEYKSKLKALVNQTTLKTISLSSPEEEEEFNTLNLIIKADVLGSAEAIEESLVKIEVPQAKIKVLKKGLGQITEDDIMKAEASQALILGFHIKENKSLANLAQDKGVQILYFDIIYKLLEEIEERLKNIKVQKTVHKSLGRLKVLAIFKTKKDSMVIGGKVIEGLVRKDAKVKVWHNKEIEAVGEIINLQTAKEDVQEVVEGNEAGIEFKGDPLIQEGDILEFFEESYE